MFVIWCRGLLVGGWIWIRWELVAWVMGLEIGEWLHGCGSEVFVELIGLGNSLGIVVLGVGVGGVNM